MEVTSIKSCNENRYGNTKHLELNCQRGITLLELLTLMAILTITLGISIPGVSAMIQTNRMATAINSLSASFALARSVAITRNQEIIICKSQDGLWCTDKGGWEQGWLIYEDINGNEIRDKGEQRLRIQQDLPPGISISFSAFRSDHYAHYWPSGITNMNGTFIFCQKNRPDLTKAIILNKTGRLRKSNTLHDGSPLQCGENS